MNTLYTFKKLNNSELICIAGGKGKKHGTIHVWGWLKGNIGASWY